MLLPPAGTDASGVSRSPVYVRHRPEGRWILGVQRRLRMELDAAGE